MKARGSTFQEARTLLVLFPAGKNEWQMATPLCSSLRQGDTTLSEKLTLFTVADADGEIVDVYNAVSDTWAISRFWTICQGILRCLRSDDHEERTWAVSASAREQR